MFHACLVSTLFQSFVCSNYLCTSPPLLLLYCSFA